MIREKEVEHHLIAAVRKRGGLCLKFVSPGWAGAPDRIVLFPGGRVIFVEVKRPGERARALQMRRKAQLERRGFDSVVVDSKEAVDDLLLSFDRNPLRKEGYKLCKESANPLRKEDGGDPGGEGDNGEVPPC